MDVLPHIQLGPVRQGEHADAFAAILARVVQRPELRTLILGVPAMLRGAKRKHALFGAALFFVPAAAAECRIEAVLIQSLAQRLREHDVGIRGAMGPRFDAATHALIIGVHQEFQAVFFGGGIAEFEHLAKIPPRCDLQQRERRLPGRKRLAREMQHHRAILAHRIQHDRLFTLRSHFAKNVNALGLEALQIVERGHLS